MEFSGRDNFGTCLIDVSRTVRRRMNVNFVPETYHVCDNLLTQNSTKDESIRIVEVKEMEIKKSVVGNSVFLLGKEQKPQKVEWVKIAEDVETDEQNVLAQFFMVNGKSNGLCKAEVNAANQSQSGKQFRESSNGDRTVREDCDSFYGSDKETDDVLMFSDDTEIDVGSSEDDDCSFGQVEHLLNKVDKRNEKSVQKMNVFYKNV